MQTRVVLIAVLLAGAALGGWSGSADAARHEVHGKGRYDSNPNLEARLEFRARGGPRDATGFARFTPVDNGTPRPTIEIKVTCLKVEGDRMLVWGRLTTGPETGHYVGIRAEDNGNRPRRPADLASLTGGPDDPEFCAGFDLGGDLDASRLTRGDIAVE